jgi:hypothetical protein
MTLRRVTIQTCRSRLRRSPIPRGKRPADEGPEAVAVIPGAGWSSTCPASARGVGGRSRSL